jgi:hypothetical protein
LRYEGVVPHVIAPALKLMVVDCEFAISVLNAFTVCTIERWKRGRRGKSKSKVRTPNPTMFDQIL